MYGSSTPISGSETMSSTSRLSPEPAFCSSPLPPGSDYLPHVPADAGNPAEHGAGHDREGKHRQRVPVQPEAEQPVAGNYKHQVYDEDDSAEPVQTGRDLAA